MNEGSAPMSGEASNVSVMTDEPENENAGPQAASNITPLPQSGIQHLRMLEAMLFASSRPLSEKDLAERLPKGVDVAALLDDLKKTYEKRGVVLDKVADKWVFRTASDLNYLFQKEAVEPKRLSKAGIETLAIIAYHQPVTRAEIEEIRGVTVSKGTIDLLLDVGWIRLRARKRTPGRPITYGTTDSFLEHFGLENVGDLPGLDDLKAAGMLEANLPPSFSIPGPSDELSDEEDPLEDEDRPDLLTEIEAEAEAQASSDNDEDDDRDEDR
jgi:segregation and condensation protein B